MRLAVCGRVELGIGLAAVLCCTDRLFPSVRTEDGGGLGMQFGFGLSRVAFGWLAPGSNRGRSLVSK